MRKPVTPLSYLMYKMMAGDIISYKIQCPYPVYFRTSYSGLLDDDYDWVRVAAREGDSRELHGGIMCMMYFDAALSQEELSAAFSLCLPIGEQLHKPLGVL